MTSALLTLMLVPVLYTLVERAGERRSERQERRIARHLETAPQFG